MGILVNPDATFTVRFFYNIIRNDNGEAVGIKILDDSKERQEETQEFQGEFRSATYEEMSAIREQCTIINHVNEKSILMLKMFRIMVIVSFCKSWNLTDSDGQPLAISQPTLDNMFEHFVAEIFHRWENFVGGEPGSTI